MLASGSPLADAVTRLESLIGRLEAGEAVSDLVSSALDRMLWMTSLPLPADLSEVREALEDLRLQPSSCHLDRLRRAVAGLDAGGPTASAQANTLLDLALAALGGQGFEEYSARVVAFDSEVAALSARLSDLALAGPSERIGAVARSAGEQAEAIRAALRGIDEAVASGSQEELLVWGQALVLAVNRAAQQYRELERLLAVDGRIPCLRCRHSNPSGRALCEECGAILPAAAVERERLMDLRIGEERASSQTQMTENLSRILQACEQFYAGALEARAFLGEVSWLEGLLDQARRQGLGQEDGLQEFQAGLAMLRQAGELEDRALVDAGRHRLWEGAGRLQGSALQVGPSGEA